MLVRTGSLTFLRKIVANGPQNMAVRGCDWLDACVVHYDNALPSATCQRHNLFDLALYMWPFLCRYTLSFPLFTHSFLFPQTPTLAPMRR